MSLFDDWHDFLRLFNAIVCAIALFLLWKRFLQSKNSWNTKTRDYWYAVVMWCVAGFAIAIEGVVRDSSMGARPVILFVAGVVTLKGLLKKGSWGSSDR